MNFPNPQHDKGSSFFQNNLETKECILAPSENKIFWGKITVLFINVKKVPFLTKIFLRRCHLFLIPIIYLYYLFKYPFLVFIGDSSRSLSADSPPLRVSSSGQRKTSISPVSEDMYILRPSEGWGTCSLASGGALMAITVWFLKRGTFLRS